MPCVSPIRAILFDKDGTLIDFQKSWEPVTRSLAEFAAGGDPVLTDHLLRVGGMDPDTGRTAADSLFAAASNDLIAEAMVVAGAVVPVAQLVETFDRIAAQSVDHHVPVCDLSQLFSSLRAAGYLIGIASSDAELSIRALVDRFELGEHLAFVCGYDSGHGEKPQPGMLLAFAKAIGVEPHEVAMVGDNLHDMHMARDAGAGLKVSVLTGTGTRELLEPESDVCLAGVEELPVMLSRRSALSSKT
ncbi:MAG: HAD family hydrolase [Rhodobacteraceae bacterium]|nr:HAD family hydrolase [Paracoccaceae bacterium]